MSQQSPNRNELDAAKAQAHPAAEGELSDADLQAVAGGAAAKPKVTSSAPIAGKGGSTGAGGGPTAGTGIKNPTTGKAINERGVQ